MSLFNIRPFRAANSSALSLFSGLSFTAFCLLSPLQSQASSVSHYLQLRRQTHCDLKLTYADVQENAAKYTGRVIELRGTVGGMAEGASGLSVMLNLEGGSAPALEVPKEEAAPLRNSTTPRIRVLARITEGSSGNVVPLAVLAVVGEDEVNTQEKIVEAQNAARNRKAELVQQEREQWHQQVKRSLSRASASAPSRGGYVRNGSAFTGTGSSPSDYSAGLDVKVHDWYPTYFNFISNHNRKLAPELVGQITFYLLKYSQMYSVDPRLVTAMIIAESDFDPQSTSRAGAMGLGQLMPYEVKGLGLRSGYDIEDNIKGSVINLRTDLNTFANLAQPNGDLTLDQIKLAMATYNAGLGAVKKYKGIPPYKETQGYVKRIIRLYCQFCGLSPE